jgi:predicted component of type VI protein secretion system
MMVKLRILHGKLQDKKGHERRPEVKVRGPSFVLGSASDCSLCCQSRSVSARHCEIRVEAQRVVVRDLSADTGTYVNDRRVEQERVLQSGDLLRIGRLEFEVLIDESAPVRPPAGAPHAEPSSDEMAEKLTDSLVEADEKERERRREDPELREFPLEAALAEAAKAKQSAPQEEPADEKGKKKKGKKRPGKLPTPPPSTQIVTEDSTEAAQEALRRLLSP